MLVLLLACHASGSPEVSVAAAEASVVPEPEVVVVATPVWPAEGAPLAILDVPLPEAWVPPRVLLDAGHGAPDNPGMKTVRCEDEQDFTRRTADAVAARLGPEILLERTRPDAALVSYTARVARADSWPAHAIIGLHADARAGVDRGWHPETGCGWSTDASGFSVLWSDDDDATAAPRRRLARAIAARLVEAGFPAYDGADYWGLWDADPEQPGVFTDAPGKRILMLRRPTVPTVLVETHNGRDPDEAARWDEPATIDAFAAALRAALVDWHAAR